MAYVNGLNGNNYSNSIYQNRNVLTGLASGMDTESMIENAMSGYKMKLDKLMQSKTKTLWQQESYRSIIQKMAEFTDKYTSYASPTNLMSGSFFNSAVNITTQGNYQDKIAASGQTKSDIQILGVKQLATSAQYKFSGIGGGTIQGEAIKLDDKMEVSKVSGSMTINFGGSTRVNISFSKDEIFKDDPDMTASGAKSAQQKFVDAINDKLGKQTITIGENTYKASEKMEAKLSADGKQIEFSAKDGSGNSVYISDAYGDLKETLNIEPSKDKTDSKINVDGIALFDDSRTVGSYLSGKTLTVNLNGVSKEITLPKDVKSVGDLQTKLQEQIDTAFGKGKIEVGFETKDGKENLSFKALEKGSTLIMQSDGDEGVIKALGFGKNASNFVDINKTLGDIYNGKDIFKGAKVSEAKGEVTLRKDPSGSSYHVDSEGYRVVEQKAADPKDPSKWIRVDEKGNELYDLEINGERVGSFNKDTQMSTVMNAINGNAKAGVNLSYSTTTNQFTFTAKESGTNGKIEMGAGLAQNLFGTVDTKDETTYKAGKDAILSMKVNGELLDGVTRSSNDFTIDGLNIKLKDTFGDFKAGDPKQDQSEFILADQAAAEKDAVTFKATSDADKIVDAVKSMIEDYNAMAKEIKDAYSTLPMQDGNNKYYEPLTDKQLEGMSESAIKAYEEKAKTGILFGDKDLSGLYDMMRRAISPEGKLGADLRAIGITTEYSGGLSTLKLDEQALRQAIEATPDKVKDVFTQSVENGAESDGLMQAIKKPLDMYGKVHGSTGILVGKAGSPLAPSSVYTNVIQQKLNDYDKQIEKLQTKMNAQIDRYTKQFSQMEQLIAMMNSQSSSLAGLMGGF